MLAVKGKYHTMKTEDTKTCTNCAHSGKCTDIPFCMGEAWERRNAEDEASNDGYFMREAAVLIRRLSRGEFL